MPQASQGDMEPCADQYRMEKPTGGSVPPGMPSASSDVLEQISPLRSNFNQKALRISPFHTAPLARWMTWTYPPQTWRLAFLPAGKTPWCSMQGSTWTERYASAPNRKEACPPFGSRPCNRECCAKVPGPEHALYQRPSTAMVAIIFGTIGLPSGGSRVVHAHLPSLCQIRERLLVGRMFQHDVMLDAQDQQTSRHHQRGEHQQPI